jgi:hypothetical protein
LERKLSPPEPVLEAWARTRAGVHAAAALISELTPERHKGLAALAAVGLVGLGMRSRIARYGVALTAVVLGIALTRSARSGAESARSGSGLHLREGRLDGSPRGGETLDRSAPGEAPRT